jgi:DNA-binding MarR family transcriptional regulator
VDRPRRLTPLRLIPALHRGTHRVALYLQSEGLPVTQGEAHVLAHLHEVRRCSIGELHRAFAHRRSTLTSILDRLVARDLVRREVSPEDRRSFLVSLTPRGTALARQTHQRLSALESRAMAAARGADLDALAALVEAMESPPPRRGGRPRRKP